MRLGVGLTGGMMSTKVIMFEAEDDRTGKIRLEWWPEGFVLWAGGKIVWRAWDGRPGQPRRKKAYAPYSAIVALRDRSHPPPKFHSVVDNKN
jgi:hypothetical protein